MSWATTGSVLTVAFVLGVGAGVGACGGARSDTSASLHALGRPVADSHLGYVKGDGDDDPYNPRDDYTVRTYGHDARVAERKAVAALVRRYFGAIATGEGRVACGLLARRLRKQSDLSSTVPVDYSSPATAALAGEPCGRFMTGLSHASYQQLAAADAANVIVAAVRVKGRVGLAVLGFRTAPERQMAVRRERGTWKIDSLLDLPIP